MNTIQRLWTPPNNRELQPKHLFDVAYSWQLACSADSEHGYKRQIPLHVLRLMNVSAGNIPLRGRGLMAVANGVYFAPEDDNTYEYYSADQAMTYRGVFQEICSIDNQEDQDDEVCVVLSDVQISRRRSSVGMLTADMVLIPILNAEIISYQEQVALKVG